MLIATDFKVLDFLLKMAKARYGGTSSKHQSLPKGEMNVLANFFFYMNEKSPNWYLEDPMKFYQKFREVWVDYWSDNSLDEILIFFPDLLEVLQDFWLW